MAGPLRLGRVLWMALVVSAALAAPNQDRRKLKVSAAFGARPKELAASDAGRAPAFEREPKIITEPLPGQEFVFISAGPAGDAERSATNGDQGVAPRRVPSARVAVDEDGILVAARPLHETLESADPSARAGRRAFHEPKVEPFIVMAQDWTPLSLSDLLSGSGIVSPQDTLPVVDLEPVQGKEETDRSEHSRALVPPSAPVAEQFTLSDALTQDGAVVGPDAAQGTVEKAVVRGNGTGFADSEDDNVVPSETVSSRTVIKKASNGQDYEYEYLYYDEDDVEAGQVSQHVSQEPSLLDADRPVTVPGASGDEAQTEQQETTENVAATTAPTVDAFTVREEPHAAVEAWTVGAEQDPQLEDTFEEDAVATTASTTTTTTTTEEPSTSTTTELSTPAAPSRRRRPTRPKSRGKAPTKTAERDGQENRSGLLAAEEERQESSTRFPPRAHLGDSDGAPAQGKVRVVESSSFRKSGGASGERFVDSGTFRDNPVVVVESEPVTVGRLTILSGPVRLPAPVEQGSAEEREEDVQAPVKSDESSEHEQEAFKAMDEPQVIAAVPFEETGSDGGILKSIREQFEQRESAEEAAESPLDQSHHEEQDRGEESPNREIAPTRPDIVDLLAFSRAVAQEAEDEQADREPAIEEVFFEQVPVPTTPATLVFEPAPVELIGTESPAPVEETLFAQDEVAQLEAGPAVEASPAVQVGHSEQPEAPVADDVSFVAAVETAADDEDTETPTTPAATTTTSAPSTTTTTTEAPTEATTRGRGSNRFGSSNGNKFANRIRNRERDGTPSAARSSTTTTTTAVPATRRTNLRGNSFSSRLRRPTTEAPTVQLDVAGPDESPTSTAAPQPSTRRTNTNVRNRFNFRRNITTVESSVDEGASSTTTTRRPNTERRQPSPRTRPSSVPSRLAVDSARPVSPLFRRGRPGTGTSTSTTAEPSVAPVVEDVAESVTEPTKDDDASDEVVKEEAVTEPSTTSTTTAKLSGLNRLRNRNPIAVSERPRVSRPQISVDDRRVRNRLRTGTNKKVPESSDNALVLEEKPAEKVEARSEEPGDEELVELVTPAPFKGLRQRRPGQWASNRRGST